MAPIPLIFTESDSGWDWCYFLKLILSIQKTEYVWVGTARNLFGRVFQVLTSWENPFLQRILPSLKYGKEFMRCTFTVYVLPEIRILYW